MSFKPSSLEELSPHEREVAKMLLAAEHLAPLGACPYCGGKINADFVDIGVGQQQVSPYRCDDCGAVEMSWFDDATAEANSTASMFERFFCWWKGPCTYPWEKIEEAASCGSS